MSNGTILYQSLTTTPPKIISCQGIYILLESGEKIIDAGSGVGVSCLAYPNEEVLQAVITQAKTIPYAPSAFTSEACERLARCILKGEAGGLSHAIFYSSGSEAMESAIKIGLQYWKEKGLPGKQHFISRQYSYHGNTIGALSISGHEGRRQAYKNWLSPHVSFVDPCYVYRAKPITSTEEEYAASLLVQIESCIHEKGHENIAAFVAETVPGSTLGCVTACKGYFAGVRELCDRFDILLILDEV
jgi:adenosylmethionine-8-amino-7-oxononanoate aminotransferase